VPLATSNLTITSTAGAGVLGAGMSLLFTSAGGDPAGDRASVVLGGALGYITGNQTTSPP